MTKTVTVVCDYCAKDLSDAGAMPTFRLCLNAERVPNSGDIMYAVHVSPPIPREVHFCGLKCLREYLDKPTVPVDISTDGVQIVWPEVG